MSDAIADRGLRAGPRYVADFDRCTPADALAPDATRGRWQTLPFEAEGISGSMLFAGPETLAPDVTYPLRVEGWHAVSVGIHPTAEAESEFAQVPVKLSGDSAFTMLTWSTEGHHLRRKELQEIYLEGCRPHRPIGGVLAAAPAHRSRRWPGIGAGGFGAHCLSEAGAAGRRRGAAAAR